MIRMAIFGSGGFGREVMPLARNQWSNRVQPQELIFVDDNPCALEVNGQRVLTYVGWLALPAEQRQINIAIADSVARERLVQRCMADDVGFFEIRAANVVQLDNVQLGRGAILSPFVTLSSNIRIGHYFHANLYSYVAHDCIIGDYVTFAPGAKCLGNVVIEDHAYIGAGAVLRQGKPGEPLVIGRGAMVGMGAVVGKSVPAGATVVGNPARPLVR